MGPVSWPPIIIISSCLLVTTFCFTSKCYWDYTLYYLCLAKEPST
jgi:hypothetical protein